ncbi:MAG: hypothetical protein U9Q81_12605 [Pseudomonadota bacterium]|nr:hypothetical protein [Pseudomonadota bacterium]
MKFCSECGKSLWPFVVVFFVAGFSAFLTWLTLSYSQVGMTERIAGSAVVFVAVGATLAHYVVSCMRRHCRHEKGPGHQHRTAH